MNEHLWWYVARASGLVAWGLLTASMLWGFLTATRILGRRPRPSWVLDLHRSFGGLAVIFVGVHLAGLALDSYVELSLPDLFIPFVSDWRPLAMAWGITAFYLLVAVELTSLLKKRLAIKTWRWVHWLSYPLFGLATIHMIQAGTDSRNLAVIITMAVAACEVVFLLLVRLTVRTPGSLSAFGSPARNDRPPASPAPSAPVTPGAHVVARTAEMGMPVGPPVR